MPGIIMVPSTVHAEGYTALPATEDIKMTRLVLYEERLGKLHKKCTRLLKDVGKKLGITRKQLPSVLGFTWNTSKYKLTSIEELALLLEQSVMELAQSFIDIKKQSDEARALLESAAHGKNLMQLDLSMLFEPEEYVFIDCFYCIVERRMERGFLALFDPRSIACLKKDGGLALYKIYCLKADSDSLFETLSQKYVCRRVEKHSNADKAQLQNATEAVEEAGKKVQAIFGSVVDIELHIALLRIYTESLHRFGLPPEFKYKFVEDVRKELKELGASNKHLPRAVLDDLPLLSILEIE